MLLAFGSHGYILKSWVHRTLDEIEWQKCEPSVINNVGRTKFCVTDFCCPEKLLLYLRAATMLGQYARYDEK